MKVMINDNNDDDIVMMNTCLNGIVSEKSLHGSSETNINSFPAHFCQLSYHFLCKRFFCMMMMITNQR